MKKDSLTWLKGRLDEQLWRLTYLYWIENKQGHMQRFTPNAAQLRLYREMGNRNIILKARQLGISTFVELLILDHCLFTPNYHAGIIDKSLPDAEQKLEKIRFAWENLDHLPPYPGEQELALALIGRQIKTKTGQQRSNKLSPCTDTRSRIAFDNGSDVRIGTTLRGGTMQMLHISELAHTSVHSPWRAREIRTGAINTVPTSGTIIIESTHEGGRYGVNYEIMTQAMENKAKQSLSPLDFRFTFLSWFDHEHYTLAGTPHLSPKLADYFKQLQSENTIQLSPEQQHWYARMERTMGSAMKQEYPSTAEEALSTANDHSIYGRIITQLRQEGKIGVDFAPHDAEALYTSWDLGLSDHTAIWLIQCYGGAIYWLHHYAANQQPLKHYAEKIREWEEQYGPISINFLPHDAARRDPHGHSYVESLALQHINNTRVVPRTPDVWRGINTLRELLHKSWFHANTMQNHINIKGEEEPSGLRCLELYRSAPASSQGSMKESPLHDESSHSADAARTFAEAYSHHMLKSGEAKRPPKRAVMC